MTPFVRKYKNEHTLKYNTGMFKKMSQEHLIAQHPELAVRVPNPSPDVYRVKTFLGTTQSLIRPFCATPAAIRRNCRPDHIIRVPGSGSGKWSYI